MMSSTTVRISPVVRLLLRDIADEEGTSMQAILEKAVEQYRRRRLLEQTNAAFQSLRADPAGWAEELEERRAWEPTLGDGQGGGDE